MSNLYEKDYSTTVDEIDALLEYYDMIENQEILTNMEEPRCRD